jgi:hypothetical protein
LNRIRHGENKNNHLLNQIGRRSLIVNYRQEEKKILDQILDKEVYDARMRPSGFNSTDGPTVVYVNLFVRSFEKIDDVKMVSKRKKNPRHGLCGCYI